MPYIRADQAHISVSVNNVPYPSDGGSWRTIEGGDLEADDAKVRPGGMGREVAVGGPAQRNDATVGIPMDDIVTTWIPSLEDSVGWGRVKITYQFLGPDRVPTGLTHTIKGINKGVTIPDMESTDSDVGDFELVVSCDELPA